VEIVFPIYLSHVSRAGIGFMPSKSKFPIESSILRMKVWTLILDPKSSELNGVRFDFDRS
jgi:hypothetical protein